MTVTMHQINIYTLKAVLAPSGNTPTAKNDLSLVPGTVKNAWFETGIWYDTPTLCSLTSSKIIFTRFQINVFAKASRHLYKCD